MKKILAVAALGCAALAIAACGPDNVGACEEAQTALDDAYTACEIDTNIDLSCSSLEDSTLDCTAYYQGVTDSATCNDDGTVDFDYGDACA